MAQAKKVMISMPDSLLQEIDLIVRRETGNRSAFIREALILLLEQRRRLERLEVVRIGYEQMGKINLCLAEEGLTEELCQLKAYENHLVKKE